MFKVDMKEKQLNEVILDDITFEVFEELIRYIYTGVAKNLDRLSFELLNQAEKVKCRDNAQHRGGHQRRTKQGDGDARELLRPTGAINISCLVQVFRDAL